MSYFPPHLDDSGLHLPTYADRLEELISKYKGIFGEDVNLAEDTPDYQMLSLFAKHLDDMSAVLIDTYNARNPNYATGSSLDTLIALNGMMRREAVQSTCELTLAGMAGTTLPAGCQAMDESGYVWEMQNAVTLDSEGEATATAICTSYGPINAPVGTINIINTPVTGWGTVTNEAEPILGRNAETDAELRLRRSMTIASHAASTPEAMHAALMELNGVTSVNVAHNDESETDDDGIPGHSISVVVKGGIVREICQTIWNKKAPGIGTYGRSSYVITDAFGTQNTIYYSRPFSKNVTVTIRIKKFAEYDTTLTTQIIPQAVYDYVNSLGIGEDLYVSRLFAVVYNAIAVTSAPFSVNQILALATGESATQDKVEAGYNEIIILPSIGFVNVVELSE